MRAAIALTLGLLAATPARAQPSSPRPHAFYILSRSELPELDARALPGDAPGVYRRIVALRRALRGTQGLVDPAERQRELARIADALDRQWHALLLVLDAHREELGPIGWLLYAEATVQADALRIAEAYDRYEEAMDSGDPGSLGEPPEPDYGRSIAVLRNTSARSTGETAAWARYIEAWCLAEQQDPAASADALRIVAASGPDELRAEARFRLGEEAFERGRWSEATAWYRRARNGIRDDLRPLVIYKLAWALLLADRPTEALTVAEELPAGAPEELRADLVALRAAAAP